jgi:TetR/AcrR family transcriptional regulator, fatty acid metabolism regulator protein
MTSTISSRQWEIIEAAGKILTDSGVSGLTTKNLAKAMDFSEGAIYRHFSSKEDIIVAMLDYLTVNMDERCERAIALGPGPEDQLIRMFENQFQFFKKNPHFVVAVFSDGLLEESQAIHNRILGLMAVKMKHLLPILTEGQRKGIFTRSIKAEELMQIIMGTFRLQMFKWRIIHFQSDIEATGNRMIQSLLTLIKDKTS